MLKKSANYLIQLIAALTLTSTTAFASSSVSEVSGSLSPDLTGNPYLSLVITVTGIADKDKGLGVGETSLNNRIEILLKKSDGSKYIAGSADSSSNETNNNFYWQRSDVTAAVSQTDTDNNQFIYTLTIYETGTDSTQTLENMKEASEEKLGVNLEIKYFTYDKDGKYGATPSSKTAFIEQVFAAPNIAPQGLAVAGIHHGISYKWTKENQILFTDDESRTPGGVIALVFENNQESIVLDAAAKVATLDKEEDVQGSCTFTPDANDGTDCISCIDANTYLTIDALKVIPGAELSRGISNSGADSLTGLDLEKTYTVALQYKNGLKRTACYNAVPTQNQTLSEFYGEDKATDADFRCFIATAAYGSPFHQHLKLFRWFRDRFLLSFSTGKFLVDQYYQFSPPLAEFISKHPVAKTVTKAALFPVAMSLKGLQQVLTWGPLWLLMTLVIMASLFALILFRFSENKFKKAPQVTHQG